MQALLACVVSVLASVVSPEAMRSVSLKDVRLTGWIGNKANNLFHERILSDWARNVMMKECEDAFVNKKDDAGKLGLWQGEYWGKTMIGFAQVADYTQSKDLLRFVKESAYRIMAQQEPDGYIGTYTNRLFLKVQVDPAVLEKQKIVNDANWNIWCRSFTAWGLYEAARVSGDRKILVAGARSLLQLIDMLHENRISITDTGTNAGQPSCTVICPMLLYYEATGNVKFLDFAKEIVAKWDREEDVPPNYFRHVDSGLSPYHWYEGAPFQYDWPKANEILINMQGLVDFARITGDRRAFSVVEKMFDILRARERNAIFSISYNDRLHDASALPSAATEGCDTVMWLQLLKKLYLATGGVKYADELELVYLNPFLAGLSRDGRWGSRLVRSHCRHQEGPGQAGMRHSHCCVNNIPRGFMEFAETELVKGLDGVYRVAFYTDAEATMDGIRVVTSGNWPVGDVAKIRIVSPRPAKFAFRRPAWSTTMKVNGKDEPAAAGWWRTSVGIGETELDFVFDLSPRFVPLQTRPDLRNATRDGRYTILRWVNCEPFDLMPYYHTLDLARIMRGPLLLAKSTRVGARESEVFGWNRIHDFGRTTIDLKPLLRQDVWGAWSLVLKGPQVADDGGGVFTTRVCDFQSAGDSHDAYPSKTFCIFY